MTDRMLVATTEADLLVDWMASEMDTRLDLQLVCSSDDLSGRSLEIRMGDRKACTKVGLKDLQRGLHLAHWWVAPKESALE